MTITVRRSTTTDIHPVWTLIKQFAEFQQTPEKVKVTPEQMIAEQELFHCFVAETGDGNIIGFASFFYAYYSWTGKAIYLDDLFVKPEFRKLNGGRLLLNAVIDLAKKENCKKVRWQVSKWNDNAIAFYKKMEAEVDDVEINCDLILRS